MAAERLLKYGHEIELLGIRADVVFGKTIDIEKKDYKNIKSNGCKLAIDDFGSGYSNFNHLFNMKPDILKLDGTLIKDINTNKNSKNILKAMVMLAKESGIQTVAEFVDNQEVDELITNIGLDFGQGYYYSPPQDLLKKS